MKFELLQPVQYRETTGYISFIDERYISICFLDVPDSTALWGRYRSCIVVYRGFWHEIRSCVDEEQEEQTISPRSNLLQIGRRDLMGAAC